MNLPFGYTFEADFNGVLTLFVLSFLLMIALISLTNKRISVAKGQLNRGKYGLILSLRILAALLLLLLIFNPDINISRTRTLPKRVAVLVDQSESMSVAWEKDEAELLASISDIILNLKNRYEIDLYNMDGTTLSEKSIGFNQDISVFDWSPLKTGAGKQNIHKAAILISDGHLNRGRSPLDLAWSKSLPVFPILPLKPLTNNLLKITSLDYRLIDNVNGSAQVQIKVQQEGLIGQLASITIYDESGESLSEQTFRISSVFSDIPIVVQTGSEKESNLTVSLSLADGDLLSENPLSIKYAKHKKQVMLLSEHVNELHKQLIINLPDSLYELSIVLGTSNRAMDIQFQAINDIIPDLIILNEPGDMVYSKLIGDLIKPKNGNPTPIIIFHSGQEPLDSRWKKLLGVEQLLNDNSSEQTVFWDETSSDHPLQVGLLGQGFSVEDLISFPPIISGNYELRTSELPVLVSGVRAGSHPALTIVDKPAQAIFNGGNYWKWFFHPQANESYVIFWEYLLKYLDGIADFKPVSMQLPSDYGATGDYIVADVLIRDVNNKPISSAELSVWQEDAEGNPQNLEITPSQPGTYGVEINTKQAGEHVVFAEVYRFGELWGRDTSRIKLLAYNEEYQSKGVDRVFLERLAKHSDGGELIVDKAKLPILPEEYYGHTASLRFNGLRSNGIFVLLLGSLIFEWLLRRRSGLL